MNRIRWHHFLAASAWALLVSCRTPTSDPPAVPTRILWKIGVPESTTRDPALADSVVYFSAPADHSVHAVRGSGGQVLWKTVVPGGPFPLAGHNLVVAGQTVAMGDADIYGLDRSNGRLRWTFRGEPDDEPGRARLASDAGTIYAATLRGRVHALDSGTGVVRWTVDLARGDPAVSAFDPTVEGGELYVGTKRIVAQATGSLHALDATTGALRWRYDFTPEFPNLFSGCFGSALVVGDLVVVPQEDGRIFALERANGRVKWISPAVRAGAARGNDMRFVIRVGEDIVATSLDGSITLLSSQTGALKWRVNSVIASIFSPPVSDGTNVYVSQAGVFAVYSVNNGAITWTDPAVPGTEPSEFFGGPLIDGDRIYVTGPTGFYALRK